MDYYPYEHSSIPQVYCEWLAFDLTIDEQDNSQRVFGDGNWSTTVHTFKQPHTVARSAGTTNMRSEFNVEKDLYCPNIFIPMNGSRRKGFKECDYTEATCVFEYAFGLTHKAKLVYKHHLGTMPNGDKCFRNLDGYLCILKKDGILVEYAFNRNNMIKSYFHQSDLQNSVIYAG